MHREQLYFGLLSLYFAFTHAFSNYGGLTFIPKIAKLPIYKCSCGINEALKDGVCVPAQNIVPLWHAPEGTDYYINITLFKEVLHKRLECQVGFSKVGVGAEFLIYSNGLFDNLVLEEEPPHKDYCIEYYYEGDHLFVDGKVCAQNPNIPICCPPGQVKDAYGRCYSESFSFNPPLIGNISWETYSLQLSHLECKEGQVSKRAEITLPYEYGVALMGYPLGSNLLWLYEFSFSQVLITHENYCVSIQKNDTGVFSYYAEFCIPDPYLEHKKLCNNTSCVRKCCSDGYSYHEEHRTCHPSETGLDFTLYNLMNARGMKVIYGFPICDDFYLVDLSKENASFILNNGSLSTPEGLRRSSEHYCLDEVIGGNSSKGIHGLACFLKEEHQCQWRWVAGSLLLGLSCLFYVTTFIVYLSIAELRTKMVGKCLISELASLIISYLTLIFLQNVDSHLGVFCNFPGTVEHIAILSSFFWLNVMCFDMWRTLSTVRPAEKRNVNKAFSKYCLYAWGFPILIGTIRLIIDHVPYDSSDHPGLIRADIGLTHCFFSANYTAAKWAYLYGPILILLLANLAFFIHVAIILYRMHKERKHLIGEDSAKTGKNLNATKERVRLYLKLFIVMGLSWILEIIMWVAVPESDCYFWGLDIVNMFQGVFIFIIFVCKKSTLKTIRNAFEEFFTPRNQRYELTQSSPIFIEIA